ncbi:MAG: YybH family protein [Pyrinomonadaceae bacterium]|jgi:ketosteroid isomerase-like protein
MKKILSVFLMIFSFSVFAAGQKAAAAKTTPDPTAEIKSTFERLLEGIRQSDADKVMSVYENSPRTLFFNNNGTVTIGWQTMLENRKSLYEKTKNVTLEVSGVRIEMLGPSAAYLTAKWKQSQEFDGKPENASGRMTLIFRKIGKQWKIVHAHTSPDAPAANRPVLPSERPETQSEK